MTMALRLLFVGGGTGGHVVPALAVAEAVRRRRPGATVRFAGTSRGVEARMVPRSGYALEMIPVIGLKRSLHPDLLRFPWMLLKGLYRALKLVIRYRPHVVFCTGGYVSGPVGIAAWALGVPLVLHEQNSFPGVTVRALSRTAVQVHLAFGDAARRVGGRAKTVTGNPTRQGWERVDRADARRAFGLAADRRTLIVVGGSQGARGINLALMDALPALMNTEAQILWQAGRLDAQRVAEATQTWPQRVAVREFIDDMAAAYSAADLALTRAGGMTLAELTRMGVPAVLVPLPTAAENHQEYNARSLVRAGAARMVRQADLDGATLAGMVSGLMDDAVALTEMAACSRALGAPDAADRIVDAMEHAGLLRDR